MRLSWNARNDDAEDINIFHDKMGARQNANPIIKCIFVNEFQIRLRWKMFSRVNIGSGNGLVPNRRRDIILTNDG